MQQNEPIRQDGGMYCTYCRREAPTRPWQSDWKYVSPYVADDNFTVWCPECWVAQTRKFEAATR